MSDKLNAFREQYPDYMGTPNGQLALVFGISPIKIKCQWVCMQIPLVCLMMILERW
jgi:hypothetical protein